MNRKTVQVNGRKTRERILGTRRDWINRCYAAEERIRELEQAQINLQQQLSDAKDDLCRLDGACWYCLNPEVEDAWRHDHHGDGRFHWHHCLDPGDGLVNDCEHSELYERIWEEAQAESEQQLKAAQDAANYMHRSYHAIIDGECSYCEYFGPTREFRGRPR